MFENAADGIFRIGVDGSVQMVNAALVKILGYESWRN